MKTRIDRAGRLSDETLGAYIDGELAAADRVRVEAYLAGDPEAAAFVAGSREICAGLHRLYDGELERRLPPEYAALAWRLPEVRRRPEARRPRRYAMAAAAAAVMAVAVGLDAWLLLPSDAGPEVARATSAAPGGGDRDIASDDPASAVSPAAEALAPAVAAPEESAPSDAAALAAPDFTAFGYDLLAARPLGGEGERSMQYVYRSEQGVRLVLYDGPVRPGAARSLMLLQEGPMNFLSWRGETRSYSLIGHLDRDTMLAMGRVVDPSWSGRPGPAEAPAAGPERREGGTPAPAERPAEPPEMPGGERT